MYDVLSGCTKEFSRPDKLKSHLMTHSCVKPYNCDICGRDFARKPHYTEHMRGHRNDYPYNCEKCKRGFFRPKLLREHRCEDANGQLRKKRLFQPRRMKRKPGRPRKVIKAENHERKTNKNVYLEGGLGHRKFVIETVEILPKQNEKSNEKDNEISSNLEVGDDNDCADNSQEVDDECAEMTGKGSKEPNGQEIEEKLTECVNMSGDSADVYAELETEKLPKKPKPECYVKISPSLVPVSMVEHFVTVQLTTTRGQDGSEIQTQLIPASDIGGQIQFATPVPGLQIPSSAAATFHPIQIIEGQPMTLTVSHGEQLGDLGVGESNVIDIPVDIVTVSNEEAMLCAQDVSNDGDASEQAYGTLVNYAPDHLLNTSVEILGPENI